MSYLFELLIFKRELRNKIPIKFAPPSAVFMLCPWSTSLSCMYFFFIFFFSTDSNPDRSTDSQGGPSGLPQAMARAHPHSARVCEGSGWPAAAQSAVNLLSCHQNSSIQTTGAGQAAFSGCKSTILAGPVLIQNSITTLLFSIASYSYS